MRHSSGYQATLDIRPLRAKAGLSQSQLARAIDMTAVAVASWERGVAQPNARILPRLAEVLGCKLEDLYTR